MAVSIYDQQSFAQYAPRSTQEIWAPLQYMREQHDKLDEEYQQTSALANAGFGNLDPTVDKAAIDKNKAYMDELRKASDDLATKGFIDAGRRSNINKLRAMYQTEVAPLQQAMQTRAQRAEEYRKLSMDKNNVMGRNPLKVSLDEMIKNPNAVNYDIVSGQQMAKDVENVSKQFADQFFKNTPPEKLKKMASFQYLYNIKQGANPSLVLSAMQNDPNTYKDPESRQLYDSLVGIVNSTVERYNVKGVVGDDQKEYDRAWHIAAQGLAPAIGKSSPMLIHNTFGESEYKKQQAAADAARHDGRSDMIYHPGLNKKGIEKIQSLKKLALDDSIKLTKGYDIANAPEFSNKWLLGQGKDILKNFNELSYDVFKSISPEAVGYADKYFNTREQNKNKEIYKAQSEIFKYAKDHNLNIPKPKITNGKINTNEYNKYIEDVTSIMENDYKVVNKTSEIRNLGDQEKSTIYSYISQNKDNLVDVDGEKVKFDDVSLNNNIIGQPIYTVDKNGVNVRLNKNKGGVVYVKYDVGNFGDQNITNLYNNTMAIQNDIDELPEKDFKNKWKVDKDKVNLNNRYNSLESMIRGRANTYIATVPIQGY